MIEAIAVALATLLGIAMLGLLLWWLSFGLGAEPLTVLRTVGEVWLLAHFVPLTLDISAEAMQTLGFSPEPLSFAVTLAPLGITLVTVWCAARAGWRFGSRGGAGVAGTLGGAIGFGAVAAAIDVFAAGTSRPMWSTVLSVAAVYGGVSLAGYLARAAHEQHGWWEKGWRRIGAVFREIPGSSATDSWHPPSVEVLRSRLRSVVRLTAALTAGFAGLAAVGFGVSAIAGYAQITAATQSLQLDLWGVLMLFVLQLVLLPVFVVWAGAWLTGAGFSIGVGTSVSPFGALLGPVPALPVFAGLPDGWGSAAVVAPLLLTLVGMAVGVVHGRSSRGGEASTPTVIVTVVAAAGLTGLVVVGLVWAASGAIGPGRLEAVGAGVWITAGLAAGELGVGALLGALAGRADLARIGAAVKLATPTVLPAALRSKETDGEAEGVSLSWHRESGSDDAAEFDHDVAIEDQITEPIEPLSVESAMAGLDSSADALPAPIPFPVEREPAGTETADFIDTTSNSAYPAGTADESGEYVSGADLAAEAPESPAAELFDQAEVGEAQGHPGESADSTPESDPLLEAFAWDAPQPETPEPGKKRVWRFPGSKS